MDRYIVVKHPCCNANVGIIVESNEIECHHFDDKLLGQCGICGALFALAPLRPMVYVSHPELLTWPLSWLRKMPRLPPEEKLRDEPSDVLTAKGQRVKC
jgi:hypothetical protein